MLALEARATFIGSRADRRSRTVGGSRGNLYVLCRVKKMVRPQDLRLAIENSRKTALEEDQLRQVIEASLKTKVQDDAIRNAVQRSMEENAKTQKIRVKLERARLFDAIARERDAVIEILENNPGSQHILISGKDNDCLYRAAIAALFQEPMDVKDFKKIYIDDFINNSNETIEFFLT